MRNTDLTISYTNINHIARRQLGLSMHEYAVAELIYHLSNNPDSKVPGWCYASKEKLGEMLDLTKQSIHKIINRLLEKGLISRDEVTKHLQSTGAWYNNTILVDSKESLPMVNNVYSDSKESLLQHSKESLLNNNSIDNNIKNISSSLIVSPLKNYTQLEDLTETDFTEIAEHYHVPTSFVRSKYEDICLWVGEKPQARRGNGRNFRLTLMNWVKKDATEIKSKKRMPRAIEIGGENA